MRPPLISPKSRPAITLRQPIGVRLLCTLSAHASAGRDKMGGATSYGDGSDNRHTVAPGTPSLRIGIALPRRERGFIQDIFLNYRTNSCRFIPSVRFKMGSEDGLI